MMQPDELTFGDRELVEKAKKRGRAYQCLSCYYKHGKVYVNEKLKMEDHICKMHVRPDEIPFYCRLCHFHCQRLDQLEHHVDNYLPHKKLVAEKGHPNKGRGFLTRSAKPYVIGPLDYLRYEAEDSIRCWLNVMRANPNPVSSTLSPVVGNVGPSLVTTPSGTPSGCIDTMARGPSSSGQPMASLQSPVSKVQSYHLTQPARMGLETPVSSLFQLPPGWQAIVQTPAVPTQAARLQADAVPVTFQAVGVVNPLDAAESFNRSGLTNICSEVSEVQGASWLDLRGSVVTDQSAVFPDLTTQAVESVLKPAGNNELTTPVLTAELLDPTQMMSAAATTTRLTLDDTGVTKWIQSSTLSSNYFNPFNQ